MLAERVRTRHSLSPRTSMTGSISAEEKRVPTIRRLLRAGCGLCAVLLLVTSGCARTTPDDGRVFHLDPSTVRERYEAWLLFAHLGSALQSVASEEFGRSGDQLGDVSIDRAHLPSSLVDLANRYVELCNELADTIESVYDTLDEVERLLSINDVRRAGVALVTCRSQIGLAREQMSALQQATTEVFTMLRRSGSGGTTAQLDQARQSLDAALALLLQLTVDYESRVEVAQTAAEGKRVLSQPVVSLQLDRDAAWVGEIVVISGTLAVGADTLADRVLLISLDGFEVGRVLSGLQGRFAYQLLIPFEYVPLRAVQVSFTPVGGDLDRYLPASSPEVVVTVRYHQTQVEPESVGNLYPGLATTIAGTVESSGNVTGRLIDVRWGDELVGQGATGPTGDFACSVVLPDDAMEGSSSVLLVVEGDDAALTAPGKADLEVDIVRMTPRIDLSVGRVMVVPTLSLSLLRQFLGGDFVRMVSIPGEIHSALPMDAPAMTASWGERQTRWQQQGASFEREAPLVISVWSMGVRTVTVRALPREPWLLAGEARAHLLVVNLFMPFVWLAALLVALAVGAAARRRWNVASPLRLVPVVSGETNSFRPIDSGSVVVDDPGAGSRVALVVLYYRAVEFLQGSLGIPLRSEMTLREYLVASTRRLPAVTKLFARLTSLTEQAMYGPREPERREVSLGRRLLAALKSARRSDGSDDGESAR